MTPRIFIPCWLVFLCCSFVNPAIAADTVEGVEQQIKHTTKQLEKLQAEISSNRALRKTLQQSLDKVELNVTERQQRIKSLNDDINAYNSQLESLEAHVAAEHSTITTRKVHLADAIRKTQRISSNNSLKVILQHDNPAQAFRLGIYTDYLMRAQKQAIDEQLIALAAIKRAHAVALKNRNWLDYIKNKAARQHAGFSAKSVTRRQSISKVESSLAQKTRSVAELKADQLSLQSLMDELKATKARQSGYFLSGKGTYPLPVNGRITAHFGEVKSVGKLRWNGLFIRAKAGSAVHPVADGEVVYSDWLRGFGMLVIVDHGDDYMTLYGGNREVTVNSGTWVESGVTIATVGDSGGQSNSGVYFEIRQNAKPLDPEKWVSAKNGILSAQK